MDSDVYAEVCRRLEDLTPGGSEFYHDPLRCLDFVEDKIKFQQSYIMKLKGLGKAKKRRIC